MSLRRHRTGSLLAPWLLAVLLVAGQMGALLHALGHLDDHERTDSPAVPQHAVCMLCVAHAGNDGALVPVAVAVLAVYTVAPVVGALRCAVHVVPVDLPYQVRAPPATTPA